MKQITLDDATKAKLKKAAGDSVNLDNLAVFRAAALTTAPVRKNHPLYLGAVHSRSFLEQMKTDLDGESRPVQIMHGSSDGDQLPIGRVFTGEVLTGTGPNGSDELEVLFWIDKTAHQSKVDLVNNGTIDQVSVAVLGKEALSNKTGFDFLGPNADLFDNIMAGTDDKGNVMGRDGAHVVINNLDQWFEMSLVGRGGATGARIKGDGAKQTMHLAASGQDVPPLTLHLSTGDPPPKTTPAPTPPKKEEFEMDATKFAETVAEYSGKPATAIAELNAEKVKTADLTAKLAEATATIATLKASDNVAKVTELETAKTDLTTKLSAANDFAKNLVAPIFAAVGKAGEQLNAEPAKAVDQVKEALNGFRAMLSGGSSGGRASGADAGSAGGGGFVNGGAGSAYSRRT
jgi:hypothetical protein